MDQVEGVGWNLKFDPRFRAIRKATLSIKTSFENVSFRVSERGSHRSRRNRERPRFRLASPIVPSFRNDRFNQSVRYT